MSVIDLLRDIGRDELCEVIREQARLEAVAKFKTLSDAHQFMRAKGRLEFTVCQSTDKHWPWEVRPKTDLEQEQDAYWREPPL